MMEFLIKVFLSFVAGGLFVSGGIWITEKAGAKIGGAITGMPSVSLVSLIFIYLTNGVVAVKGATVVMPILIVSALLYGFVFENVVAFVKSKRRNISRALSRLLLGLA